MKTSTATSKIVFFDLDGTLLTSNLEVQASSIQAIAHLREAGGIPVIATGRSICEIDYVFQATGIHTCVAMNGQYVMYEGNTIFENPIDVNEVLALHQFAETKGHSLSFYNTERVTVNKANDSLVEKNCVRIGAPYPEVADRPFLNEPTHLMVLFCKEGEEAEYQNKFPTFQFVRHSPYNCDVFPAHISKATGIKELLNYTNFDLNNTYAFGDGLNDLEMFSLVKHPIAMGNSLEIVKQHAEYITQSNNEDGIATGIQYILGKGDKFLDI